MYNLFIINMRVFFAKYLYDDVTMIDEKWRLRLSQ